MKRDHISGSSGYARVAVAAGIAFAVSGGAAAIAATEGSSTGVHHVAASASADQRVISAADRRVVARSLRREFRVLRAPRARTTSIAVPAAERAFLAQDSHGLNVADAVWVAPRGGRGTWVVPGTNGVCLLDAQFTQVCQSLSGPGSPGSGGFAAIDGPPVAPDQTVTQTGPNSYKVKLVGGAGATPAGTYTVTGLVPDGNSKVELTLHNGETATAQVTDNVYSTQVQSAPASVTVNNAAGQTVTQTLLK
jgi:hypothetical protein